MRSQPVKAVMAARYSGESKSLASALQASLKSSGNAMTSAPIPISARASYSQCLSEPYAATSLK